MRLSELQKPEEINRFKQYHDPSNDSRYKWRDTLFRFMERYGFQEKGKGTFGTVFVNPNYPYALKVFRSDNNYISWIEFCRKNPNNPFCIKSKGSPIRIVDDIFAIRIEKLEYYTDVDYFVDALESMIFGYDLTDVVKNTMDDILPGWESNVNLQEVVKFLKQYNETNIDIHQGNIMARGNQPVIIDPLSSF